MARGYSKSICGEMGGLAQLEAPACAAGIEQNGHMRSALQACVCGNWSLRSNGLSHTYTAYCAEAGVGDVAAGTIELVCSWRLWLEPLT